MELQKIKKSIAINADKTKVWNVLTNDDLTRIWYAEFSEGTYAITDWQVGHKAKFMDGSQMGIVGTITANVYGELLELEYDGMIANGVEDYDSDGAKNVKGCIEKYQLTEKDGQVILCIECDMADEYFEMMSTAWDKALEVIKSLSEAA
jgi:uncharacterized protein YndB with AHSA1/START domain